MSASVVSRLRVVGLATALAVALIAGQALAVASAPAGGVAPTGRVIGQTGFAYLGGLRTFTAAVLWTRLEPLYDGFYQGRQVKDLQEFLPTMRLVQTLDPQFEQVYYNAAWILARRGRVDEGLTIARDGIANNPDSGLLRANYIELLLLDDKTAHLDEAYGHAVFGIGPKARWANSNDQFEGYGIFRTVFSLTGDQATVDRINAFQAQLSAQGAGPGQDGGQLVTPGGN